MKCFGDPQRRSEYFRLYSNDVILHGYQELNRDWKA